MTPMAPSRLRVLGKGFSSQPATTAELSKVFFILQQRARIFPNENRMPPNPSLSASEAGRVD